MLGKDTRKTVKEEIKSRLSFIFNEVVIVPNSLNFSTFIRFELDIFSKFLSISYIPLFDDSVTTIIIPDISLKFNVQIFLH